MPGCWRRWAGPSPCRSPRRPTSARDRLARLNRRRDALIADRADEKKRRGIAVDDLERASIEAHIAWLDAEIGRLEEAIAAAIEASDRLCALSRQLQTAPAIGKVALVTLIAGLPELVCRSARRIAALVGLALFNDDSGTRRGKRRIRGGRRRVRQALMLRHTGASACRLVRSDPLRAVCTMQLLPRWRRSRGMPVWRERARYGLDRISPARQYTLTIWPAGSASSSKSRLENRTAKLNIPAASGLGVARICR